MSGPLRVGAFALALAATAFSSVFVVSNSLCLRRFHRRREEVSA